MAGAISVENKLKFISRKKNRKNKIDLFLEGRPKQSDMIWACDIVCSVKCLNDEYIDRTSKNSFLFEEEKMN